MYSNPAHGAGAPTAHLQFRQFIRNSAVAAIALILAAGLMQASPVHAAVVTEFPVTAGSNPTTITSGPDGNLWFTEPGLSEIGRITPAGTVTQFIVPSGAPPFGITAGPDGALWFTESGNLTDIIGSITTAGVFREYGGLSSIPLGITTGPDGALWFTEGGCGCGGGIIGRMTTTGVLTEFPLPAFTSPVAITTGPDGALWFTEPFSGAIGRITTTGTYTSYQLPSNTPSFSLSGITTGPDGNIWFTECSCSEAIGKMSPLGVLLGEFQAPPGSSPAGIVSGPDGALWFSEEDSGEIGRITTAGIITTQFPLTTGAGPDGITRGPDGNIWFAETDIDQIGRISVVAPSTAALRSSLNPAPAGQSVTFTATLGCGFSRVPGGTVTFLDGAITLASTPLSGGITTFSTSGLTIGNHAITAVFAGDGNCAAVTSAALTQVVNPVAAGTTLTAAPNPATVGQSVSFTAAVACAGFTPTGNVIFKDGTTTLMTVSLSGFTATFATAALAAGSHPIIASYSGDANCVAGTSPAVTQVITSQIVAPTASSVALTATSSSFIRDQQVIFNVTVSCAGVSPTGTVTFLDNGVSFGSAGLLGGQAGVSINTLLVGSHAITASYSGDANCAASVSATLTVVVTALLPSPPGIVPYTPFLVTETTGQPVTSRQVPAPYSVVRGSQASINFGSFIDPACTDVTTYQVQVDWRDGTTSAGTASGGCSGRIVITGQHVYQTPGIFTPTATVTGPGGAVLSLAVQVTVS